MKEGRRMNYREVIQKYKAYLIGGGIFLTIGCLVVLILMNKPDKIGDEEFHIEATSFTQTKTSESLRESKKLYVDIKGAVKQQGMYEVKADMRVWDAILMAGGVDEDADTKLVNFAEQVTDQMVIYVPIKGEEPMIKQEISDEKNESTESKVNLNQADETQLQTLSGIGLKKAQEIIRYREENGGFKSIEEIKNISGFGEKTFEKLKEAITV